MHGGLALALALAACSSSGPYEPRYSPVDSDGHMLRDATGRALVLRGVNVRVAGVFDVTFDDGRAPREAIPTFDQTDVAALQASGFTLVRLPVDWSGIEPVQGQYASAYLDQVAAVVDLLRGSGIYVLLDLHQDGWSKELCEDGAPLWTIDPPPVLVGGPGPLAQSPDCHTLGSVLSQFQQFFADDRMLQESYAAMVQQLAMRFADDEQVLGYEIMNEPIGVDTTIDVFDVAIAKAIRDVDRKHLVLFEPSSTRNFTDASPLAKQPFSVGGGVYAVHIYTAVFNNTSALADGTYPALLSSSIDGARQEADSWKTPLVITEYGIGADNAAAPAWLGSFLDDADAELASAALWLWKEESQGYWGLFTLNADGSWSPRPEMFGAVVRPYAEAIGGDPKAMTWDGTTLAVEFEGRDGVPAVHDVFWPANAVTILCDGDPVEPTDSDSATSRYTFACGGHGTHTFSLQ